MKRKFRVWAAVIPLLLWGLMVSPAADAQGISSWIGTSPWWDWSDFRGTAGYRIFMPTVSGQVEVGGQTRDFSDFYGISGDPQLFKSLYAIFYIDRLGIRVEVEEDHKFRGRSTEVGTNIHTISQLNMSGNKIGLDLDIIRTPFARAGINYTFHTEDVEFEIRRILPKTYDQDTRRWSPPDEWTKYAGDNAMTIGVHGRVIPFRIREVPFTMQGRFRFPIPFYKQDEETRVTEWEVSGGMRPAVWETSLLAHSTFSLAIEGGFRQTYLRMNAEPQWSNLSSRPGEATISAKWSGAFIQVNVVY
ncbi:MAG: hypothetical protein AB1733_00485 [Thermodesulfobacteriota bacterium]